MTQKSKKFIEDNIDLINNNEWETFIDRLYTAATSYDEVDDIYRTLRECDIDMLDTLTFVPTDYFAEDENIVNIVLPKNIEHIGNSAFFNCKNLTHVSMPNVINIRKGAFENCYSLKRVVLPETLECIESNAFTDTGVESIIFDGTVERWNKHVELDGDWAWRCPAEFVECKDGRVRK